MVDSLTFVNEMNDNKYVLSPKGNCQPLRRQYEAFMFNNLVFINENNTVDFMCPAIPNVHYVEYKLDCSDLEEKIQYYRNNSRESALIANAGTSYWNSHCRIDPSGSISQPMSTQILSEWHRITGGNI